MRRTMDSASAESKIAVPRQRLPACAAEVPGGGGVNGEQQRASLESVPPFALTLGKKRRVSAPLELASGLLSFFP